MCGPGAAFMGSLDVELVLQVAKAASGLNQSGVRDLLPGECSPPDDGKRENDCGHAKSRAVPRVVSDWAGKFGASIQSGSAASTAAAVGSTGPA